MGEVANASHALLSPSSAKRWIMCPVSVALTKDMPDQPSKYAEEGTLAHALCAKRLKTLLGQPTADEDAEIALLSPRYDMGEMEEHVQWWVDHVWGEYLWQRQHGLAELLVEAKLDLSPWVPESFGTTDAIIVSNERLTVLDFKYGKGVAVSAYRNPQLMIYALGAIWALRGLYWFDEVAMGICQPRTNRKIRGRSIEEELPTWCRKSFDTVYSLERWGIEQLRQHARKAWESTPDMEPHPGEWCRFCKARQTCQKGRYFRIDIDDKGSISESMMRWTPQDWEEIVRQEITEKNDQFNFDN